MEASQRPSILIKKIQVPSGNDPEKSVNFKSHATERLYHQNDFPTKLDSEKVIKVREEAPPSMVKSPTQFNISTKQPPKEHECRFLVYILHWFCFLPALIYTSVINILCPCIKHIISRVSEQFQCKTKNIDEFIDPLFLPNNESLNLHMNDINDDDIEWHNITKIYSKNVDLNIEHINVQNVIDSVPHPQNKWLLSALVNICDYPYLIKKLFLQSRENDECNKFRVKLYDGHKHKWKEIVIDDMIPCNRYSQKPLFMQPKEGEMWLLLLEKSMAKLSGSYGHLFHGDIPCALQTLTGRKIKIYLNTSNNKRESWAGGCIKSTNKKSTNHMKQFQLYFDDDAKKYFNHKQLWNMMDVCYKKGSLIVVARSVHKQFENLSEMKQIDIVSDESFSISDLKEIGIRFKFIQINNRWNYKYDTRNKWKEYPEIISALNLDEDEMDTNKFWIELNDFVSIFTVIYVCPQVLRKNEDKKDIILDIEKDATVCEATSICCTKCFAFWCECRSYEVMSPRLWKKEKPKSLKYVQTK